jgi:Lipid A 3-O-deacylase (PagL)
MRGSMNRSLVYRNHYYAHRLHVVTAMALLAWALAVPTVVRADDPTSSGLAPDAGRPSWSPWTPCDHCRIWVGMGATFDLWTWTDGLVVPLTFEFADSRWELGVFRMARPQRDPGAPWSLAAPRYWGFSAMHRWQILHRGWEKLYVGFGGSYVTQENYVNSSLFNFAYLIGLRFDLDGGRGPLLEFTLRHWSNAWLKPPNRGQNFFTLSVSF